MFAILLLSAVFGMKECEICYEDKPNDKFATLRNCNHDVFCLECMERTIGTNASWFTAKGCPKCRANIVSVNNIPLWRFQWYRFTWINKIKFIMDLFILSPLEAMNDLINLLVLPVWGFLNNHPMLRKLIKWVFIACLAHILILYFFSYSVVNLLADYMTQALPDETVNNAVGLTARFSCNFLSSMSSKFCFMGIAANYDVGVTLGMSLETAREAFSQSMIDNQSNYEVLIDKSRSVSLEVSFPQKENYWKFVLLFARVEPLLNSMRNPTTVPMKIDSVMMQIYCKKEFGETLTSRRDAYFGNDTNQENVLNKLKAPMKKTFMFHHDKYRNKLELRDIFPLPLNHEKIVQVKFLIQTLVKISNFSLEDFKFALLKIGCYWKESDESLCKAIEHSCASTRCYFLVEQKLLRPEDCKEASKWEDSTDLYYLSKFSEEEMMRIIKYVELIAKRDPFFASHTDTLPDFVNLFQKEQTPTKPVQAYTYKIPATVQSTIDANDLVQKLTEMSRSAKMTENLGLYNCQKTKLSPFDDPSYAHLPPTFVVPRAKIMQMTKTCQPFSNYDSAVTLRVSPEMIKNAFSKFLNDDERNYKILIDQNARSVNLEVDFPHAENLWKFATLFARIEPMVNLMRNPTRVPMKTDSVMMQIYCRQTHSATITSMKDVVNSRDVREKYVLNRLKSSMKKNYIYHHDEDRNKLKFREIIPLSLDHEQILQVQFFIQTLVKISNFPLKDFKRVLSKIAIRYDDEFYNTADKQLQEMIEKSCASTRCHDKGSYSCKDHANCVASKKYCFSKYEEHDTDQIMESFWDNSTDLYYIAKPPRWEVEFVLGVFEDIAKLDAFFQNHSATQPNFKDFFKNSSNANY